MPLIESLLKGIKYRKLIFKSGTINIKVVEKLQKFRKHSSNSNQWEKRDKVTLWLKSSILIMSINCLEAIDLPSLFCIVCYPPFPEYINLSFFYTIIIFLLVGFFYQIVSSLMTPEPHFIYLHVTSNWYKARHMCWASVCMCWMTE